jgi:hypothetical protein
LLIYSLAAETSAATSASRELHVLFIGNSFTYYNNMPAMLASLSLKLGQRLSTSMVVEGGASLRDQWESGKALATLKSAKWDYVVLGDQSTFGQVFIVEGRYRVASADELLEYGAAFDSEIKRVGAKTVLLCHWKDLDAPPEDQDAIDHGCAALAHKVGTIVVPAGAAFSSLLRSQPSVRLYDDDGHHPTAAASYLVAALLHGAIVGRSAEGGPAKIEGYPIDPDSGQPADSVTILVDLEPKTAQLIQSTAWSVKSEFEDGSLLSIRLPSIALPTLPRGQSTIAANLVGAWSGRINLYPWKGKLNLRITAKGEAVELAPVITFGGRPDDIEISPTRVGFDGKLLSWVDSKGPNGSTIKYTGVFDGFQLRGIAEMTSSNNSIYGIGTWELDKLSQ